jgi:indole-3-glycerol phosphate synthase
MNFLHSILQEKAHELAQAKAACSEADMRRRADARTTPFRGFAAALRGDGIRIIAEIKRASPSKGDLAPDLDPSAVAAAYAAGGAAALSVLTEPAFFKGSIHDLQAARDATALPVLRKDFIIDPYQIHESRAIGADAVLLIVRILDDAQLRDFVALTRESGLDALVEVFDDADLDRALAVGAPLVGINNRNLATFDTDLANAAALARRIAPPAIPVALSGVGGATDVAALAAQGLSRFLVGEALVRSADPAATLKALNAVEVPHG